MIGLGEGGVLPGDAEGNTGELVGLGVGRGGAGVEVALGGTGAGDGLVVGISRS